MVDAPERIWIEHGDECPYFYEEDELHEAGSAITEYVRADVAAARVRAEADGEGGAGPDFSLQWQSKEAERRALYPHHALQPSGPVEVDDPHHPYLRIVNFFDKDETAGSFLSEDGEGGFVGAIYRMAREIDRLRLSTLSADQPGTAGGGDE